MSVKAIASSRPLLGLLELGRRARETADPALLRFMAVNETHALAPYRQAALWQEGAGVQALSGVVQVEANAPYVQWLAQLCKHAWSLDSSMQTLTAAQLSANPPADLPADLASDWQHWLPEYVLWLPFKADNDTDARVAGGLLLARDLPWTDGEKAILAEWVSVWAHAWFSLHRASGLSLQYLVWHLFSARKGKIGAAWWQRRSVRWALVVLLILIIPVRLVVLAPGELVPANPAVIRAPLDGVLEAFFVQPNAEVQAGDVLFAFDEILLRSRLEVARHALTSAEAEYRQAAQQALSDPRSKALLASLTGTLEERRAETDFLQQQLGRARVEAPRAGLVLFDDPSEWIGRPVATGERIMRIAMPGDVEVEAWVPLADAIPLQPDATVTLYLNSSPLDPVAATLRYLTHDAVERPDGTYAYRLRATLDAPVEHRVGLKGSARIAGRWVPLGYWVLRRPLAVLRAYVGV